MSLLKFASEIDREEARHVTADAGPTIRKVIELADKGAWAIRVRLPNGRRLTVESIVRLYRLEKFVRSDLNLREL